jgi:hypothetical protein
MFSKIIFSLFFLLIGLISIHFLKNEARDMEEKINLTSKKILLLSQNIETQRIEYSYLASPERIAMLAKKYLAKDYIHIYPEIFINEKK